MALHDSALAQFISEELSKKEDVMYSFAKGIDDNKYDSLKHSEIGKAYTQYLKTYIKISREGSYIHLSEKELPEFYKTLGIDNLFCLYDKMEDLIITINRIFSETLFCSKFRIYKFMFQLLYVDLEKFNISLIIALNELTNRISATNSTNAMRACQCYSNYIEITKEIKDRIINLLQSINPHLMPIKYFEGDISQLKVLKESYIAKVETEVSTIPISTIIEVPKHTDTIAYKPFDPQSVVASYDALFGSELSHPLANDIDD